MPPHVVWLQSLKWINKDNTCPHLPVFFLGFIFHLWTKNIKHLYPQYQHGSTNLKCTFNLTLKTLLALILIWKGLKFAKHILPCLLSMSLWLQLLRYLLDTDLWTLIGSHITGGCPSLVHVQLIGQLKHVTIQNWEWANYHTRTLRNHDVFVMSKPQVIIMNFTHLWLYVYYNTLE